MIVERLPTSLINFLTEVESLGFSLTLVGGVPRDFLFADMIGDDFDFEIRANKKIETAEWPLYYQKLLDFVVSKKLPYKVLPYLITRVDLGDFKLEFSSPRIEVNKEDNFSHHHFDATLDSNLSHEISFRRRDFTINAIGFKLDLKNNCDELIDPYDGVHDLKEGVLKNISDDFFHDSVRFLRLVRFHIKFDRFVIDSDLLDKLSRFNLTKLSVHHFKEELFKSSPGKFLNLFQRLVKEHSLKIPPEFSVWTNFSFASDLTSKEDVLAFVFLQEQGEADKVAHFFSLPAKTLKDLKSFYQSYEYVSRVDQNDLKILISKKAEDVLGVQFFKELKNLEEKKAWKEHLHLGEDLPIGWKDWAGTTVDQNELDTLPASMRSYLIFYKALKQKYSHG